MFASFVVMPTEAVSNTTYATLSNSHGKMQTTVEVGKTGAKPGDFALDHFFDANASSHINSTYAVWNHYIKFELKKDGVQGTLSVGIVNILLGIRPDVYKTSGIFIGV